MVVVFEISNTRTHLTRTINLGAALVFFFFYFFIIFQFILSAVEMCFLIGSLLTYLWPAASSS